MKKAIIIDGNSLINRAFYALPSLTDKNGNETNAIYGFSNILFKILTEYAPDYMAVAFDLKKPTFRHKMYDGYKKTRKGMPDELSSQMEPIKEMLDYFGITKLEMEGYEADDILGTVSKILDRKNIETFLITGDKDSFQLASENVKIVFTKRGISEFDLIDEKEMIDRYGITPKMFIDLKGLMGDTSDNIPGVKGIGEKTGLKLLKEYPSLEEIYENIDSIKGSIKKKLIDEKEIAFLSKKLATIIRDIPVEFSEDDINLKPIDSERLKEFFDNRQMISLIKRLYEYTGNEKNEEVAKDDIKEKYVIEKDDNIDNFIKNPGDIIYLKIIRENIKVNKKAILSLAIISRNKSYIIDEDKIPEIKDILENENIKIAGFDIKNDILALLPYEVTPKNYYYDLKIADYIINPESSNHDIKDISIKYSLGNIKSDEEFFGKGKSRVDITSLNKSEVENYYLEILQKVLESQELIVKKLEDMNMEELFKMEMNLAFILADMQFIGVKIDKNVLKEEKLKLQKLISTLEKEIYEDAGEVFNINSPKQLGVILFEKLNLQVIKKTKTGYSTSAEVLDKLSDKHEIINKILDYRTFSKLYSTFVEGLSSEINEDTGRIHSTFNQTVTSTGRISSTEPNLQNIPVRTEEGRNLRKVFVAEDGYVLVDADYSQIELRVLAHISGDENLIKAFNNSYDIHTHTAGEVFGVSDDLVTSEMRSSAKAVNFGIVYGISGFGLAKNLNISPKEAQEYIDKYLARYPKVKAYMENIEKEGKKNGYVTTIMNRRRYIPELRSKNFNMRNLGKRLAMNTPIQGSAADIIKLAMVKVYKRLKKEKLKSRLILQIHDELMIETSDEEKEIVEKLLKEEMENVVKLKVDLIADVNTGKSWFDTK